MRWIALKYVKPGLELAQRVTDERGRTLLAKGVLLTESLIFRLNRAGIRAVCVRNASTEDVVVRDQVDESTKQELLGMTYETLAELSTGQFSSKVKPNFLKKRFSPVLNSVIYQLRSNNGAGDQLSSVYLSDGELFHHSVNVTFYAVTLGIHMGMSDADLLELAIGTTMHDIGKLQIPMHVLQKPGRLTTTEFDIIKLHPQFGYDALKVLPDVSARSALVSLQHHERLDGSGYPNGLKGSDIHPFSKVTAVVDVYEALTANRVYREAYLPHEALNMLLAERGTRLYAEGVDAFLNTISIYPLGMSVRLSNGDSAVVIRPSAYNNQEPVVRAIENEKGEPILPYELNLAEPSDIHIVACEC